MIYAYAIIQKYRSVQRFLWQPSFRYFHFNGAGSWMCVNFRAAFKNAHSRFPRRRRVTVCTHPRFMACYCICLVRISFVHIFRDKSSRAINHPINSLLSMSNVLSRWNIEILRALKRSFFGNNFFYRWVIIENRKISGPTEENTNNHCRFNIKRIVRS